MKKFVCTVCGYVFEGEAAPAECPVCHAGADKFKEEIRYLDRPAPDELARWQKDYKKCEK